VAYGEPPPVPWRPWGIAVYRRRLKHNRTWRWDLPVIFRWVRLPSKFRAYLCLFGFSVFLSILFNTSLNVRMLECNTEIPYLDEPVKLVFKLHFST